MSVFLPSSGPASHPESARPLAGRVALVTGVSRPQGIGGAVASRLIELGAEVFATGWPPHDDEQSLSHPGDVLDLPIPVARHDFLDPEVPGRLIDEVVERFGRIDIVVGVHARSSPLDLAHLDAAELDRCWAVNVRSLVLIAQRFAERHVVAPADSPPVGRMIWFTSGQHHGPMDGELPYAISKGALHQMTASLDRSLSWSRIIANCINPGPVDTGWASDELHQAVAERFPDGQWGSAAGIADLVAFLTSDVGRSIRGQVIDAESGFRR